MKIQSFIIVLFMFYCTQLTYPQSIHRDVTGVAGTTDSLQNLVVSWTIGECVTGKSSMDHYLVSQGFHQGMYKITSIEQPDKTSTQIKVYPNPTSNVVNIEFTLPGSHERWCYLLTNAEGQVLQMEESIMKNKQKIDLSRFNSNVMYLIITDPSSYGHWSYKLIKINQ